MHMHDMLLLSSTPSDDNYLVGLATTFGSSCTRTPSYRRHRNLAQVRFTLQEKWPYQSGPIYIGQALTGILWMLVLIHALLFMLLYRNFVDVSVNPCLTNYVTLPIASLCLVRS